MLCVVLYIFETFSFKEYQFYFVPIDMIFELRKTNEGFVNFL